MKYFYHWLYQVRLIKAKKQWEEDQLEELEEREYAIANDEDPIYWCWNCKHSDCDRH